MVKDKKGWDDERRAKLSAAILAGLILGGFGIWVANLSIILLYLLVALGVGMMLFILFMFVFTIVQLFTEKNEKPKEGTYEWF